MKSIHYEASHFIYENTALDIGITTIDHQMKVIHPSAAFQKIYGIHDGACLPQDTNLFLAATQCMEQQVAVTGILLTEVIQEQNRSFLVYLYPHNQLVKHEKYPAITIMLCDCTLMHKEYDDKLENEKRKLIGEMGAGFANLILNPLTVIKGSLQLISRNLQTIMYSASPFAAERISRHISLANQQVEQIHQHIQRFLQMGKPLNLQLNVISVSAFLAEFIPKIQLEALQRNLTLICEYPSREANLLVHPAYLQKVLDEIILNSFEASQLGGHIHIRTEVSDISIVFSIIDHGSGIPEALLSLVLAPFFTTKDGSLGLGLSFCDIMIRKMEGYLDIQSTDSLTTVIVTLPNIGHFN